MSVLREDLRACKYRVFLFSLSKPNQLNIVGNIRSVCSATLTNLAYLALTRGPNYISWILDACINFMMSMLCKSSSLSARSKSIAKPCSIALL